MPGSTDRPRRRGAVLAIVATAVATGCTAPARAVSELMVDGFLPALGTRAGFAAVTDWRTLRDPSDAVRSYFEFNSATYRVISAQRDQADLVVWQTAQAGAEPFNGNVEGTGHGCVTLTRTDPSRLRSTARPCPTHLGPPADSYPTSWGRDADAVTAAENTMSAVDSDVRWLLTRDDKGYPRRVPATRREVLDVVRVAASPPGTLAVRPAARQRPGRFAATLTVSGSAADPVDTRRVATAQRCAVVDVALDGTDPSGQLQVLEPARCR